MPEYPFKAPDGEVVHLVYSMREVPSIGSTIEHEGRTLTRLASDCLVNSDPVTRRYPVESRTLPRNLPPGLAKKSARGLPIVRNAEHAKRLADYTGMTIGD